MCLEAHQLTKRSGLPDLGILWRDRVHEINDLLGEPSDQACPLEVADQNLRTSINSDDELNYGLYSLNKRVPA